MDNFLYKRSPLPHNSKKSAILSCPANKIQGCKRYERACKSILGLVKRF